MIGTSDTPSARLAEPDALALACAHGTFHDVGIDGRVGQERWFCERAEWRLGARDA